MEYRGSSGYGRAYRMKLKGNWGIVDIEDVCAGAEYLVKKGGAAELCHFFMTQFAPSLPGLGATEIMASSLFVCSTVTKVTQISTTLLN